jgi:hypothetical protein
MQKKEVDKELFDDIVFYYEEKKRLTIKNYQHRGSEIDNAYFKEAAELCNEYELDAASYVHMLFERMGNKKEFFTPKCLRGTAVKHFLASRITDPSDTYKVEITNATLDPKGLWEFQHELAMRYIKLGRSVENVLMDSGIKFFAWFRILATPNAVPAIIDKYKHIAKKEMTSKIMDFARSQNLDLDRII